MNVKIFTNRSFACSVDLYYYLYASKVSDKRRLHICIFFQFLNSCGKFIPPISVADPDPVKFSGFGSDHKKSYNKK